MRHTIDLDDDDLEVITDELAAAVEVIEDLLDDHTEGGLTTISSVGEYIESISGSVLRLERLERLGQRLERHRNG